LAGVDGGIEMGGFKIINFRKLLTSIQTNPGQFRVIDELVKSRISDGFVKSPRSRLANPEE
jgi:hypothetical protein